jgi:amino acid transporter
MVSTYGYLSGQFVSAPRLTFAFAERRDFPAFFAAVHPKFRTPYISIAVYTALALSLAIYGSFIWNAILSSVARLLTYGLVCAALMRLRVTRPQADAFRLPGGWLFALAGMAFCVVMVAQMTADHMKIILAVAVIALVNWFLARRH